VPYDFFKSNFKVQDYSNLTFVTSVSVRTVIKQFLGLSRLISGHVQKFADTNYTNVQPFLGLIIFIATKLFVASKYFHLLSKFFLSKNAALAEVCCLL